MYVIRSTANGKLVYEAKLTADGEHAYGQAYSAFHNAPHGDGDWQVTIELE